MGREPAGDFTDRQHHLIESAGMEDIRIQMMGFAVVAKIEAKYLKAALLQGGCGMQHELESALPSQPCNNTARSVAGAPGTTLWKPCKRSEEHTYELHALMHITYYGLFLTKKTK